MPQLLRDFFESKFEICEDNKATGQMKVRGRFQAAETRNANGRIYPNDLWERVLKEERVKDMVETRRMLGCVEHPTTGVTSLSDVSHIVTSLTRDGNDIIGEAEVLNTPQGMIIQELLRRKVPIGISSRGRGTSIVKNGAEYVNSDDFVLETFDFVYKPSTPGAYPELQESVLSGSAFAKDTPMIEKINKLKKFDVRATEIAESLKGKLTIASLNDLFKECLEMRASAAKLTEGFTEGETGEHGDYAKQVVDLLNETQVALTDALDSLYQKSDLSRRVDDVLESTSNKDSAVSILKDLLAEANQENEYLRNRLEDISSLVESDENEIVRRCDAATTLAQETVGNLQEALSELADLAEAYDTLEERYNAAVELVAGVQTHQATGRLASLVQEAVDAHPVLSKFMKTLRSCKTEEELAERVEELVEGMGLNKQASQSNLASRLSFSGALGESVQSTANEVIDAASLNESAKNNRASAEDILESNATPSSHEQALLEELLGSIGGK